MGSYTLHRMSARRCSASIAQRLTFSPCSIHATQHPAITTPILRLASTLSKALRFAPTPFGAYGLDRLSVEPREGTYAMAGQTGRTFEKDTTIRDTTIRDTSSTPNIAVAKCAGPRLADRCRKRA